MKSIQRIDSELMQVASGNLPFDGVFLKLLLRDSCFYPSPGLGNVCKTGGAEHRL